MKKEENISVAFSLDLEKILKYLSENNDYMAQLGDITFRFIGVKEDTVRGKREIFEIERLCSK